MDNSAYMSMKDAIIIFSIGLMTITITITAINGMAKLNREWNKVSNTAVVCKGGGLPDYRCKAVVQQ